MEEKMFCFQCQETAGGTGCKVSGVCGKGPELAALQDLLVNESRSLASVVCSLENQGMDIPEDIPSMLSCNLFMTITNANFDAEAIKARVRETVERKLELIGRAESEAVFDKDALWDGEGEYVEKGKSVGVLSEPDENKRSLRELITYGLKGIWIAMAADEILRGIFFAVRFARKKWMHRTPERAFPKRGSAVKEIEDVIVHPRKLLNALALAIRF